MSETPPSEVPSEVKKRREIIRLEMFDDEAFCRVFDRLDYPRRLHWHNQIVEVIDRLRESVIKSEYSNFGYWSGSVAGEFWARNIAPFDRLQQLHTYAESEVKRGVAFSQLFHDATLPNPRLWGPYERFYSVVHSHLKPADWPDFSEFWQRIINSMPSKSRDSDTEYINARNWDFLSGFAHGAIDVWEKVRRFVENPRYAANPGSSLPTISTISVRTSKN